MLIIGKKKVGRKKSALGNSMTKGKKIAIIVSSVIVVSLGLAVAIPFIILGIRSSAIDNAYSYLISEKKITDKKIEVPLVKQEISCGYAIIEMLSSYYGNPISEEELYEQNNKSVSTATTSGFVSEINKRIKGKNYSAKDYLKNDELLLTINNSLLQDKPVPVEWAAKFGEEWTLHWSIVTGMDQQYIYVNNPYGYKETISYDEFISRTTFKAFTNMNIGYQFGFAFGLFSKNTIIV